MTKKPAFSDKKVITPAIEYARAAQGVEVDMPSGKRVRLRNVTLAMFVKLGKIPDSLSAVIASAVDKGMNKLPDIDNLQTARDFMLLLEAIVELAYLDPKVVSDRDPDVNAGEIHIDWVPDDDKYACMELLGMAAAELSSFRPEQSGDVESVAAGEDNGAASEPDHEPVGVGEGANGLTG